MFKQIADIISENIDNITRRWVDELRQSERTQIHHNMLTAEIVSGTKVTLHNLAQTIAARESPDHETVPMYAIQPGSLQGGSADLRTGPISTRPRLQDLTATRPLGGPLERAQQSAAKHGQLRHSQGFELHEVILEYVKLRQIMLTILNEDTEKLNLPLDVDMVAYVDLLIDELMLTSTENFYHVSVRDLEKRAIRDPLTQLYNKDYFQQRLQEEMRRALRHSEPLTVVMIDLDRLKPINDTYGHPVGDAVLSALARVIDDTSRQSDIPCRYGGDEFAVILPETAKSQAEVFASRVLGAVRSLSVVVSQTDRLKNNTDYRSESHSGFTSGTNGSSKPLVLPAPTISIGISSFPEDGRNPEMLVARADAALYRAKREGRNRVST